MCPMIPTSNQDGHQAKNRKKGDDIFLKSSPLKLLSQSQPNFAEMILGWSPSNWFQTRWFLCEFPIGSYVNLSTAVQPSWSEGGTTRHNFGRGPSNGYFIRCFWKQLWSRWAITGSWDPLVLFIHNHLTLIKWCYTRLQHDLPLDPIISPYHFHFQNLSRDFEKTTITAMYHGRWFAQITWKTI
jgi:hypothetical protein